MKLPGIEAHCYVDRVFFGRSYRKIHREMDKPFKKLRQCHRILFHDPVTAGMIAQKCYPGDPQAWRAAQYHIMIDRICTSDPWFKDFLEAAMRMDRMARRKKKRWFSA